MLIDNLTEGDHIKVTASKYPFPTVCADKQSTDWFHSISRTLKWNERERQKSFVVVEEDPAKPKRRRRGVVAPEHLKISPEPVEEAVEDEDEDDSDDEEGDEDEEEGFDIDDSSPEAATLSSGVVKNSLTVPEERLGQEKAYNGVLENALHKAVVASALRKGRRKSKSRSRSRSGLRSGVDSPSRFAYPQSHPAAHSPRHVEFALGTSSPPEISETEPMDAHCGARDDIYSNKTSSSKSRIPKDRDDFRESLKTPTATSLHARARGQTRSRSADHHGRRAFAVWGHDESDTSSNASDSSA